MSKHYQKTLVLSQSLASKKHTPLTTAWSSQLASTADMIHKVYSLCFNNNIQGLAETIYEKFSFAELLFLMVLRKFIYEDHNKVKVWKEFCVTSF